LLRNPTIMLRTPGGVGQHTIGDINQHHIPRRFRVAGITVWMVLL
jgi:hypothetical protein